MTAATAVAARRRLLASDPRWILPIVVVCWIALWFVLRDRATLALGAADLTPVHARLNRLSSAIDASRNSNPLFRYFFNEIRVAIDQLVTFIRDLISQPPAGRPVPQLGWLGVVALAGWVAFVVGGLRAAVLSIAGFVMFGLQGLWQESMDTLALTIAAVILAVAIGIPLGVWAGLSGRVSRLVTPVLDFMQTMPTFVYLAPLTLFFLIGPASAVIATLIYAVPPVIRITAHAIRSVAPSTVEAATAMGATRWQKLARIQLPMASRTIVLGVNQTMMAALSMVTIAALIDAPGLGQTVIHALETLDVGTAFNAGLAIVIMAIVLDRVTTAASARVEPRHVAQDRRWRRPAIACGAVAALFAVYLSRTYLWAAQFPERPRLGGIPLTLGSAIIGGVNAATSWIQAHLGGITEGLKNAVTYGLLNPLQALLAHGPWYLTATVVFVTAFVLAGRRVALIAAACLALLVASGVWYDAMVTLAATLVATALVMVLGLTVGVWIGRSAAADRVIRPVLDAGQTMPAFVYLVPFLGLFGTTRFTAIVAAVVYAAPASIKLVADGVRGVAPVAVEAATAAGSSRWQLITKVQLPMAKRSVTLAANQGLIYVLAMVVVGGLVGAGALGYDVVAGFAQLSLYGKGLAAGVAIVLLGILLDRITHAAAHRAADAPSRTRRPPWRRS